MVTGIGSGLGGQFGMVAGVTYRTGVTVTRFLELESESLKADVKHITSNAIGRGRFLRSDRHKAYIAGAAGDIVIPITTKGCALPLKMCLGSNTITTPSGTERKHHLTADAVGLFGMFFTAQLGRPSIDGTINPYNYPSCKVTAWEISCKKDGHWTLKMSVDADTEEVATALASSSFASAAELIAFNETTIAINGSTILGVEEFTISGKNPSATDRRGLGNTKLEPIANDEWEIMANLKFEFESLARRAKMVAATAEANLIITGASPTLTGASQGAFRSIITIPVFRYMDGQPAMSGPDVLDESMNLKAEYDGSAEVFQYDYYTTDTAA